MNIFYYSVHAILESDEVNMLHRLGHDVMVMGPHRDRNTHTGAWRDQIPKNPAEEHIHDVYESLGGKYSQAITPDELYPPTLFDHFSVVIVMHSVEFILENWEKLKRTNVVWRTIGQGVDFYDTMLKPYKEQGLKIVRYSPVETEVPNYLGHDAIIRFGKDSNNYSNWNGNDKKILSFANKMQERYPREAESYRRMADGLPFILGGTMNEALPQTIGFVSFQKQIELYQNSRAYLYCTGMDIPYTLNFMEAWMTGIPVIIYAPCDLVGPYFEIDRLITDGVDGYVCRTIDEVRARARVLLDDDGVACAMGAAGRQSAIRNFGGERIDGQWREFLHAL